jgi:hypothetical protein
MPEDYTAKDIRPPAILAAINLVKARYSDQLDREIVLASTVRELNQVDGKVKALEHIFTELHSEISKLIIA